MDSDLEPCVLALQRAEDDGVGATLGGEAPVLEILEDGDEHSSGGAEAEILGSGATGKTGLVSSDKNIEKEVFWFSQVNPIILGNMSIIPNNHRKA
jgi:hypothetical protein